MDLVSEDARDTGGETLKHERTKHWAELNESEKLERMREVVKHQDTRIARLSRELNSLARKFREHGHKDDGAAVLPADFMSNDMFGTDSAKISGDTEVYF